MANYGQQYVISPGDFQISDLLASTSKLIPTNILHVLVFHDMDALRALDNPRNAQGALVLEYNPIEASGVDMGHGFYE